MTATTASSQTADDFTGDIVRIAPNELALIKPQASKGETRRYLGSLTRFEILALMIDKISA